MNPIENLWGDIVKDSVFFRPRSADEVFDRSLGIWNGYSRNPTYWHKLAHNMVKRLACNRK
jgi:hypothetical protein